MAMLRVFADAGHLTLEEAQFYDQRVFGSMLQRRWIDFTPMRGFFITPAGLQAWQLLKKPLLPNDRFNPEYFERRQRELTYSEFMEQAMAPSHVTEWLVTGYHHDGRSYSAAHLASGRLIVIERVDAKQYATMVSEVVFDSFGHKRTQLSVRALRQITAGAIPGVKDRLPAALLHRILERVSPAKRGQDLWAKRKPNAKSDHRTY